MNLFLLLGVHFEGVGQPSEATISASPVFLELLTSEMTLCKKWGLNIGVSCVVCLLLLFHVSLSKLTFNIRCARAPAGAFDARGSDGALGDRCVESAQGQSGRVWHRLQRECGGAFAMEGTVTIHGCCKNIHCVFDTWLINLFFFLCF